MHPLRHPFLTHSLVSSCIQNKIKYFILNPVSVFVCQKRQCSNAGDGSNTLFDGENIVRSKKLRIKQGKCRFDFVGAVGESVTPHSGPKSQPLLYKLVKEQIKPGYTCLKKYIANIGMPRGYPSSCAEGYSRFFYFNLAASFFSSFSMSIATQALLSGFFAESTAQIWMIKDLAPSLIAAYLANRVASYELRPKYWMMISVFMTQASIFVDLLIPGNISPDLYLWGAIASSIVKHNATLMHFVARASILQHFATHQNLGEIQKKFNSFGMVNFTVASAMGILLTTYIPSFYLQLAVVSLSSCISISCTYYGVKHTSFCVLTPVTAQLSFQSYLKCPTDVVSSDGTRAITPKRFSSVLTTEEVNDIVGFKAVIPQDQCMDDVFVVNPKLETLKMTLKGGTVVPTSDRTEKYDYEFEGTLLQHHHLHFTIGLWEEVGDKGRTKLVLLVHTKCDTSQLYGALLMCYESIRIANVFLKEGEESHRKWQDSIRSFFSSELQDSFQRSMEKSPTAFRQAYYSAKKDKMVAQLIAKAEEMKMNTSENKSSGEGNVGREANILSPSTHRLTGNFVELYKDSVAERWIHQTAHLTSLLEDAGWDVINPSIDPIDLRIESIIE
eukprot:Tbor_TRINITY_DN2770_c0_g1::TRINITY_DN2770_c0_g1_i1::g.15265::m.15265